MMTLPRLSAMAIKARNRDNSLRLAFPLGNWVIEAGAGGAPLMLTLSTPDGFEVTFAVQHATLQRMAETAEGTGCDDQRIVTH